MKFLLFSSCMKWILRSPDILDITVIIAYISKQAELNEIMSLSCVLLKNYKCNISLNL